MAKATKRVRRPAKSLRERPVAYVLKVTLREVRPPIWRRVRVAGDLTPSRAASRRSDRMPDPEEDLGEPPLDEQDYELRDLVRKGTGSSTTTISATTGRTASS